MSASTHTIELILKATDQGVEGTLGKLEGKVGGFEAKMKGGLGFGIWAGIGKKAVDTVFGAISSNMDGAIKRFDTLNNYPKVMQSLGFSAEQAEASVDQLSKGIEYLPTTLDKVTSQTQQFTAITGDIDKATELTLALNNAMASGGAPAEQQASAINQWAQAMSKGKPDLQDWRALVQTAPAQMNQLAEATLGAGKTQADLYEALKDGSVSIDEVNDNFIKLSNEGLKVGGKEYASFAEQAKSAGGGIQLASTNIKASIQRNIANVLDGINKRFEDFGGIAGVMQKVIEPINFIGDALSKVADGSQTFAEMFDTVFGAIGEKAQQLIPIGMEMVGNLLIGIAQQLPSIIYSGGEMIYSILTGIASGLPDLVIKAGEAVATFVEGMGQNQSRIIPKAIELITTFVSGVVRALPKVLQVGMQIIVALINGVASNVGNIVSFAVGLGAKIPQAIKRGIGSLFSIGANIVSGLWNGIKAKWDGMVSKLKEKAKNLPKAVKKVLGIASPSKVFMSIGNFVGEGMAIGIEKSQRQVDKAMAGLYGISNMNAHTGFAMAMNDDYSYNATARYEIIVPVELNGREIARATAGDMQTELNRRETMQNRRIGIR